MLKRFAVMSIISSHAMANSSRSIETVVEGKYFKLEKVEYSNSFDTEYKISVPELKLSTTIFDSRLQYNNIGGSSGGGLGDNSTGGTSAKDIRREIVLDDSLFSIANNSNGKEVLIYDGEVTFKKYSRLSYSRGEFKLDSEETFKLPSYNACGIPDSLDTVPESATSHIGNRSFQSFVLGSYVATEDCRVYDKSVLDFVFSTDDIRTTPLNPAFELIGNSGFQAKLTEDGESALYREGGSESFNFRPLFLELSFKRLSPHTIQVETVSEDYPLVPSVNIPLATFTVPSSKSIEYVNVQRARGNKIILTMELGQGEAIDVLVFEGNGLSHLVRTRNLSTKTNIIGDAL